MNINDSTLNYLLNAYSDNGEIAKKFDYIFTVLEVDKDLICDAFFEVYHNDTGDDYDYRSENTPSYNKVRVQHPEMVYYYFVKLAYAYVIHDINKNILHFDDYKPDASDFKSALHNLETINFQIGIVTEYLTRDKIQKSEIKLERSIQSLGGASRAKKYEKIKVQIYKDWENGNFYSYAECARKYADKYKLSNDTIERWLSKKYLKQ